MSLLAPAFAWLALAASLVTVLLHLLARRQPRVQPLPTARFVPETTASAAARARRPSDLAVLAARVAALVLAGLAAARPSFAPPRRPVARVVVAADTSPAAFDSAAAWARAGDVTVLPAVRGAALPGRDTVVYGAPGGAGRLTTALVAAIRASGALRERADSIELVVVAPFTTARVDAATDTVRALWPGRARLVPLAAAPGAPAPHVEVAGAGPSDPVAAAVALMGRAAGPRARLVRRAATAGDSAFAAGGGVLIVWPADPAAAFTARVRADTIGALSAPLAPGGTVVAPFVRRADPPAGATVLWWADGEPAASAAALGEGCVRSVAVGIAPAGDLALRASLRAVVRALAAPCGGVSGEPLDAAALARLAGPAALMAAGAAPRRAQGAGLPAVLFLGAALAALALEAFLRRRPATS